MDEEYNFSDYRIGRIEGGLLKYGGIFLAALTVASIQEEMHPYPMAIGALAGAALYAAGSAVDARANFLLHRGREREATQTNLEGLTNETK